MLELNAFGTLLVVGSFFYKTRPMAPAVPFGPPLFGLGLVLLAPLVWLSPMAVSGLIGALLLGSEAFRQDVPSQVLWWLTDVASVVSVAVFWGWLGGRAWVARRAGLVFPALGVVAAFGAQVRVLGRVLPDSLVGLLLLLAVMGLYVAVPLLLARQNPAAPPASAADGLDVSGANPA